MPTTLGPGEAPQAPPPSGTSQAPNTTGQTTPSNPSPPPNFPGTPPQPYASWTSDPIYQLVVGQTNLAIANAKAEALKQQTQALIAYGDPNLALQVTGDQNVANAAAANKASTLAQLVAGNQKNVHDINDSENQQNLFYSSDRGYQLGLNQQAYLYNQANAAQGVQGQLSNIAAQLVAQEQQAYQNEQQAAQDAYGRASQNPPGIGPATSTNTAPTNTTPNSVPNNQYGGAGAAPVGVLPKGSLNPYATKLKANQTGGSANQRQGVFAIH